MFRSRIKDRELKKRYLKHLGYDTHEHRRTRTLGLNDMKAVFDQTIGHEAEIQYDDLVADLIAGGIMVQSGIEAEYSFGHLSFQEHLAGMYMADFLTPSEVLRLCRDPWWLEPVKFYAAKKGDIGPLVRTAEAQNELERAGVVLESALAEAPYTSVRDAKLARIGSRLKRISQREPALYNTGAPDNAHSYSD